MVTTRKRGKQQTEEAAASSDPGAASSDSASDQTSTQPSRKRMRTESDFTQVQVARTAAGYASLLESGQFSDFVLRFPASGTEMRLHKAIMSGASEFFKTCLSSGLAESRDNIVEAGDTEDEELLQALVRSAYTSQLAIPKNLDEQIEMYRIAHKYQFVDAMAALEQHLAASATNAEQLLMLLGSLGAFTPAEGSPLMKKAESIIFYESPKFLGDETLALDFEPFRLVLCGLVGSQPTTALLQFAQLWVQRDHAQRQLHAYELMQTISEHKPSQVLRFSPKFKTSAVQLSQDLTTAYATNAKAYVATTIPFSTKSTMEVVFEHNTPCIIGVGSPVLFGIDGLDASSNMLEWNKCDYTGQTAVSLNPQTKRVTVSRYAEVAGQICRVKDAERVLSCWDGNTAVIPFVWFRNSFENAIIGTVATVKVLSINILNQDSGVLTLSRTQDLASLLQTIMVDEIKLKPGYKVENLTPKSSATAIRLYSRPERSIEALAAMSVEDLKAENQRYFCYVKMQAQNFMKPWHEKTKPSVAAAKVPPQDAKPVVQTDPAVRISDATAAVKIEDRASEEEPKPAVSGAAVITRRK